MKNKFLNKKNLISSCALILCIAFAMLLTAFQTDASDGDKKVEYISGYTYTESVYVAPDNEKIAPKKDGYLFAGWYTKDDNVYNPVRNPQENEEYYAKFVPEEVLDIRAQVSAELFDDNTGNDDFAAIRFITSLDNSLNYHHVGFNIKKGSTGIPKDADTTKFVYRTIYAVGATDESGEPDEYVPEKVFHSESYYLKTWTIANINETAYNTDVTVVPYWITLDGTRVEGTKAIKTVNLGRSWVYVNAEAHTDGDEYGTYKHPYTDLVDAIDAIVLDEGGKIVIKTGATITWDSDDLTWETRGKDFTITGQTGASETLDFSSKETFRMGDNVTFEKMTLKLPTKQLYADGHRFKIAENVVSDNSDVIIFGGGNNNNVTGDTSVTLLSGSYEAVYGGGLNGDVDGNTYVTIQNVDIYDANSNQTRFVFGGGRKGNVKKDTHVTVGEGFNSEHEWDNHEYLSAVFGGGYGDQNDIATVDGNTYVVIKDGAKTNYVHGAGMSYSDVKGTSHVTFDGGCAMSVYGGGSSVQAANASTYVEMKAGTVEQIFGGNSSNSSIGMTGNTDVRILGGTILRRVYGGCYNEYKASGWKTLNTVDGYVSVTFGPDTYATLKSSYSGKYSSGDCAYLASSRYNNTDNETGIFIVNDCDVDANATNVGMVGHSTDFASIKKYNYLVKATEGGAVYSEGGSLRVIPDPGKVATVRVDSAEENVGTVHAYITSEEICELPELDSTTGTREVYVVFTDKKPEDVDLSKYEATANGILYETLEEAIRAANTLSTTTETTEAVVVTLLKDAEVEGTLNIEGSANIVIQNGTSSAVTVNRTAGLTGSSLLNVASGATVDVNDIVLDGRSTNQIADGVTSLDTLAETATCTESLIVVSGNATFENITVQYAVKTSGDGGAMYVSSGDVSLTNCVISNNSAAEAGGAIGNSKGVVVAEGCTFTSNQAKNGGAIVTRYTGITLTDCTIGTADLGNTATSNGGAIYSTNSGTVTLNVTGEEGTSASIVGNSATNGGAFCISTGTLTMNGYTISENSATSGAGVYVGASSGTAKFIMNGGTIESNTATGNTTTVGGGGVYITSTGTVTMNDGTIRQNTTGKYGGGIFVNGGTFNMNKGTIAEHVSGEEGIGIFINNTGAVNMTGDESYVKDNKGTGSGAGVSVYGGTFTMNGGEISGNEANASGGAFIVRNGSVLTINNGTISRNKALVSTTNGGGAIFQHAGTTVDINGGTISGNESSYRGGAIYMHKSADSTLTIKDAIISGNTSAEEGGAVYVCESSTLTLEGGATFKNNTATTNGGALGIAGSVVETEGTSCTFTGNSAVNGGAIYVDTAETISISGMKIQNNTASSNGGGICVYRTAGCTLSGGTISGNTAVNGGGVYTENKGKFTMNGGSITSNTATACGGGVYVGTTDDTNLFTMNGGTISGHGTTEKPSAAEGAGVYVISGGKFNLTKGTITDNHTTAKGAGVSTYGTFNMSGTSTIHSNTTTGYGGGVYVGSGTYTLNNGATKTIYNNQAANGAGVAVIGTFKMKKGIITENTATENGGGIAVAGGTFEMMKTGDTKTISSNNAVHGAGVCVEAGTFTMNEGEISSNTSTGDGAGVYLYEGVGMTMVGGKIINNSTSSQGGAIAAIGNNDIKLTSGEISGNTGSSIQGIYLTYVYKGTVVTFNVNFNMGTNEIRFNNVSNTHTILKFEGGDTLTHHSASNPLHIGLRNNTDPGCTETIECISDTAAANIIEALKSNSQTWTFAVSGSNIIATK